MTMSAIGDQKAADGSSGGPFDSRSGQRPPLTPRPSGQVARRKVPTSMKVRRNLIHIPLIIMGDRKSTRLNSSHVAISYAVFCLKKKKHTGTRESRYQHLQ